MRHYDFTLTGETPLLMHWDNIDWADEITKWCSDPDNKNRSKAGDDRTPPWKWIGCVYNDGKHVVIPSDNLAGSIMQAGAMVVIPGGNGKTTFKSKSQSGMMSKKDTWPLLVNGSPIDYGEIEAMRNLPDFAAHVARARDLRFELLIKRARVGQSKHVRVRPCFRNWEVRGSFVVADDEITEEVVRDLLERAGRYKGLCDWRPSSKQSPGPYGVFSAKVAKSR